MFVQKIGQKYRAFYTKTQLATQNQPQNGSLGMSWYQAFRAAVSTKEGHRQASSIKYIKYNV